MREQKHYSFTCLPNNLLVQMFETVSDYEVTGRVFIYIDGCTKPKTMWRLMPNDGYLYWHGYLDPSLPTWVDDVVVGERSRRQGLGTILVRKAEERMKEFGVTNIEGIATREGALLWQSLGYTIDEQYNLSKTLGKEVRKMTKEPLYPHKPKGREPQFPHTPKGQSETQKGGTFVIGHDHMGNLIVTHTARTGEIFLQFESDRQVVYDILQKWELKEVEKGWSVQVKDTEPRASILDELWDVQNPSKLPQVMGEPVPPQYRDLISPTGPLPRDAY